MQEGMRGEYGIAGTPTMITMSILIILLILVYQSEPGEAFPIRHPVIKVALSLLAIIILIGQGGKSNMILFPFTFIVMRLMNPKTKMKAKIAEAFLLGIATVVLVYLFFGLRAYLTHLTAFERLYEMTDLARTGEDVDAGRTRLYTLAWEKWKEQPFLGHGWYSFYLGNIGILKANMHAHAHNLVLELLHDLGFVGLCLITTPIFLTFFKSLRLMRKAYEAGATHYVRKFSFFLAFHIFFFSDAMLHVSFYQRDIMILYFIYEGDSPYKNDIFRDSLSAFMGYQAE